MDKITSKFGVVSLDAPDTRLPIHTNKSGPDAVWDMIVDNAKYKGYTINRADYEVSGPYTPEGATSNRVTRVDITNKSDPLFKIDSKSYIDYVRHDLGLVEDLRYPYSHSEFSQLLNRLNSTNGLKLTESDFDMDSVKREDGLWTIKASSDSYYWIPGSWGVLYDRGGWTKIADWFATDTIPDLRGLILNLEQPTWDVRRDAVNYIQSNRAFNIPWNDLIEHPVDKNADGSYRYLLDRKPLMEYIEPQYIQYRKLTLSEYMHHPGAATVGVIPFDRQGWLNFSTKNLFNQAASGTGSGGYIAATDTFYIDTTNKSYNRINIPTDFVGVDWKFLHSGIAKIEFTSTYRKGRYWFKLGGETPDIGSFVDNPIPELDRKNILGISEEASDIPLRFEYFLDFTDVNVPLSTLFINGEFIWEGPITRKYSDNPGSNTGEFIFLAGTSNAGTHSRLEITDFNLHALPLGSPKESSYVQVNASVTGLSDGTIYDNLPRLNEFYKVHLTEENVEDGPLSTTEPTTLVARDGDVIIEAESEFIVDTAPNLASVFLNTDLDGFDGWDPLGPGQQVSYIGYEYPDGRHTRYMGRVDDTEFFTPQEVMEAIVGDSGITYQIPYSTTQWFKYQLDGDIVYVPMKPLANHISYNELKSLGVVNRSGDHLARVPANTVGNYKAGIKADYRSKIIHKDGRAYVVRMIKGLNQDGPMLPYVVNDSDNAWTHDSEWNRMFYNLARQTILPAGIGDNHASQKGPKWEFISAADLVVENNGSDARYTLAPELTIESGVVKPIYRGCYGASVRGRNGYGLVVADSTFGFRPLIKLLGHLTEPYSLRLVKTPGEYGVEFQEGADYDLCLNVEVYCKKVGWSHFSKVNPPEDGLFTLSMDTTFNGAEIYFKHTDGVNEYTTTTLTIPMDSIPDMHVLYDQNSQITKDVTYPTLAGRIASTGNATKTYSASHSTFWADSKEGYFNVMVGGYSSGWGTGGNTTRYISSMAVRCQNGMFESRLTGRYYSNNGNTQSGLSNVEMMVVFPIDEIVAYQNIYTILMDYVPTGNLTWPMQIFDVMKSKSNPIFTLPTGNGKLAFEIYRSTLTIYWNNNQVWKGPFSGTLLGVGRGYTNVPARTPSNEPLYGIGMRNLLIYIPLRDIF